eukprot:3436770-Rhodomonas_salina.1
MLLFLSESGDNLEDTIAPPSNSGYGVGSNHAGESTHTVDPEPEAGDSRQPQGSADTSSEGLDAAGVVEASSEIDAKEAGTGNPDGEVAVGDDCESYDMVDDGDVYTRNVTNIKGQKECEAFKARRRSDTQCCCTGALNLSKPDASSINARFYLACDRSESDGARGEQALGVKLEMNPGWTVEKGVARYRREKMSSAELAKYGLEEDPKSKDTKSGKQQLRLTPEAMYIMFKIPDRVCIEEYIDLFGKDSVVVDWAKKSTSHNRRAAIGYLRGSLEVREGDGRKYGFDDGHWDIKEAIKVSQLRAKA